METQQRPDGILYAVAGASRFGKTHWVKQRIKEAKRLLIIRDPRLEYLDLGNIKTVDSVPELAAHLAASTQGGRFIFTGSDRHFEDVCNLAYLWAQQWPCVLVAEEISDVTTPSKAPDGWGDLIRKGLYYGAHIYSITQRPAECDNTVWGNASVIHTHGMVLPTDVDAMAKKTGAPYEVINGLEKFEFIEKYAGEKDYRRGKTNK